MTAGRLTENICGHAGFGWHAGWPPVVYVMDDGAWMVETMVSNATCRDAESACAYPLGPSDLPSHALRV